MPDGRGLHAATAALEQRGADQSLQLVQDLRRGGLRDADLVRGGPQAAPDADLVDEAQVPQPQARDEAFESHVVVHLIIVPARRRSMRDVATSAGAESPAARR